MAQGRGGGGGGGGDSSAELQEDMNGDSSPPILLFPVCSVLNATPTSHIRYS